MFCSAEPCSPAWTFSSSASSLRAARLESKSSSFSRSTIEVRQLPPPPLDAARSLSTASTSTGGSAGVAAGVAPGAGWAEGAGVCCGAVLGLWPVILFQIEEKIPISLAPVDAVR